MCLAISGKEKYYHSLLFLETLYRYERGNMRVNSRMTEKSGQGNKVYRCEAAGGREAILRKDGRVAG